MENFAGTRQIAQDDIYKLFQETVMTRVLSGT